MRVFFEHKRNELISFLSVSEVAYFICIVCLALSNKLGLIVILCVSLLFILIRKEAVLTGFLKIMLLQIFLVSVLAFYTSSFGLWLEATIKSLLFVTLISLVKTDTLRLNRLADLMVGSIFFTVIFYPYLLHDGRFSSFFAHPNHLAYISVLMLVVYIITGVDKFWLRSSVITLLVILSGSSGGFIVLSLIFLSYFLKRNFFQFLSVVLLAIILSPFVMSLDIFSVIASKLAGFDFYNVYDKAENLGFGSEGSFVWRVSYWIALISEFFREDIVHRVLGLGVGVMSYGNYAFEWMITDPHNDYVRLLMEQGWIGSLLYLYFLLLYTFMVPRDKRVYLILVLLVPMFVGNILTNYAFMLTYFLIINVYSQGSLSDGGK